MMSIKNGVIWAADEVGFEVHEKLFGRDKPFRVVPNLRLFAGQNEGKLVLIPVRKVLLFCPFIRAVTFGRLFVKTRP